MLANVFFEGRPLTTSYRWLNPFIFTQYSIVKRLPQIGSVDRPIFILGIGRSGTTILGRVLSIHHSIGFLNEPKALWYAAYNQDDLMGSYSEKPGQYILTDEQVTPEVRSSARKFFSYFGFVTHSERILDKYPEMIFRVPFVKAIFPDAKLVWITRDGWDVIHSIRNWSDLNRQEQNSEREDWWGLNGRKWDLIVEQVVPTIPSLAPHQDKILGINDQQDRAAVEWICAMETGLRIERERDDLHRVSYEQLTSDCANVLRGLCAYLEVDYDATMISYGKEILSPRPPRPKVELNPVIADAFHTTMLNMGYRVKT